MPETRTEQIEIARNEDERNAWKKKWKSYDESKDV